MPAPHPTMLTRRVLLRRLAGLAAGTSPLPASARSQATAGPAGLDEMIGQMLIVGFWGADPAAPGARAVARWLGQGWIGGVIFFDDNLPSPGDVRELTGLFTQASGPAPPLLSVDQEGGAVARLRPNRGFAALPSAQTMAEATPEAAAAWYERCARELRRLGLNLNFGPVVDLSLNARSRVISGLGRSYGADPALVTAFARAFVQSHRRHRVLTALKHFPGHGSTPVDSHRQLPDITAQWQEEELRPYAALIGEGLADAIMVGHLVHADLFHPRLPATLSGAAIEELLRGRLGHSGLAISDDMHMAAIRRHFSPDQAILLGIEAGLDLFIYANREFAEPDLPDRFLQVVKRAVEAGRVTPERIRRSYGRIMAAKGRVRA